MTDATRLQQGADGRLRAARMRAAAPYLLALLLFGLGAYALYHLLAPVEVHAVAQQIRSTPWQLIALAMGATFAGYLCLAAYDWSALRHIGKRLPLPVVISGGFLAYAFGNTVGLTAVSGGAVRWRLYSGLDLDGYDIAAVSTFTAAAFGVASTVVGLAALAVHPLALASLLPLSAASVRLLALAAILVILVPLIRASLSRKQLRVGRFQLQAPSPSLLAMQLLISLGDITFSALTLYLLLPAGGPDFMTFVAVFAAATMAGVVSHVPGGVGVFETIIIAALPAAMGIDKIAAALLLYRLIYYLVPFAIALILMALFESWRAFGGRTRDGRLAHIVAATEPAFRAIAPAAPLLLAMMVFGSGLWMSLSALLPPISEAGEAAEKLFPLAFIEGSALLTSALGAWLIVLSLGLARRSQGALWLTMGAMLAGAVVAALQRSEIEQAVTLVLGVLILLPFRHAFRRHSVLTHGALTPGWAVLMLAAMVSVGFVLFFAHKSTPYARELWWQFAANESAPRALRSGLLISLLIGAGALLFLLRAPLIRITPPDADTLDVARRIAMAGDQPDAGFVLTGDKAIMLSDDRSAFVMFGISGRSWLAFGAPVGDTDGAEEVAFTFVDAARRAGARPVFYEIGPDAVPLMLELGMVLHKMGEEAVVDLTRFSLEGPSRKRLRTTHARAGRDGLSLEIVMPPHDSALMAELQAISDDWLAAKNGREKGFSVGRFDPDWLNRWPIALARQGQQIVAFANIMTTNSRQFGSIDLMRYSGAAPGGTMEFMFTEVMLQLKAQGFTRFSLGMAPLAGLTPHRSGRIWDRFGHIIYRRGGRFYNFEGLRAFKRKFDPEWYPHYLATSSGLPPLVPLTDAARLIARDHNRSRNSVG
ncbi:bifunctional lysylphosphatidylglycerol flippase/synthetase MprF [Paracoccus xiamenensis]|uniref:bifunctional lysylphosphatidylglycerol flippase/synthetase MprF n=1 Tax=Paracoccus xiamenensis TaxID=2714901 RepID=UPI001F202894|nr:bifunctional lysylphosphatidylglycerol flippase/synthetase MprF [Paracoccus xiamenensis]